MAPHTCIWPLFASVAQMGTWKSGAFHDEVIGWLRTRMSEVLDIRSVVHQLSAVLSPAEITELQVHCLDHPSACLPLHPPCLPC